MQKASEVTFEERSDGKKGTREPNADVPPLGEEVRGEERKASSEKSVSEQLGEVTKPL